MNLPNVLSLTRASLAIPLFFVLRQERLDWALVIFVAALVTDFLDGRIARRWNLSTELGRVLDPVADKMLVAGVLAALVLVDRVPRELVVVVVLRDALLVAWAYVRYRGGAAVPSAAPAGKVAFALLGAYLVGVVVGVPWPGWVAPLVGALYAVSGAAYASRLPGVSFGRVLKEE
ncbi:MAG: hypothetical protein DHS20C21_21090 [Gemmatimonadota bacterium]|nr:MAG: hypothetical protein DHS20C21_21090 [Gemmatimonadota bacterium]